MQTECSLRHALMLMSLRQYSGSTAIMLHYVQNVYLNDGASMGAFQLLGYRLDGLEGYVYPKSRPRPTGAVKLLRKYNPVRDDHAIFPEGSLTQYSNEGYTQNSGTDWLGYVYLNSGTGVPVIQ